MHRRMLLPGLAAALALACATAAADTAVLDLDPQATRVNFHFGATFKGVRGSLAMPGRRQSRPR